MGSTHRNSCVAAEVPDVHRRICRLGRRGDLDPGRGLDSNPGHLRLHRCSDMVDVGRPAARQRAARDPAQIRVAKCPKQMHATLRQAMIAIVSQLTPPKITMKTTLAARNIAHSARTSSRLSLFAGEAYGIAGGVGRSSGSLTVHLSDLPQSSGKGIRAATKPNRSGRKLGLMADHRPLLAGCASSLEATSLIFSCPARSSGSGLSPKAG